MSEPLSEVQIERMMNSAKATIEALTLSLRNAQDEIIRLREQQDTWRSQQTTEERIDIFLMELVALCRKHAMRIHDFRSRPGITLFPDDCLPWADYPKEAIRVSRIYPDGAWDVIREFRI